MQRHMIMALFLYLLINNALRPNFSCSPLLTTSHPTLHEYIAYIVGVVLSVCHFMDVEEKVNEKKCEPICYDNEEEEAAAKGKKNEVSKNSMMHLMANSIVPKNESICLMRRCYFSPIQY